MSHGADLLGCVEVVSSCVENVVLHSLSCCIDMRSISL